MNDPTEVTVAAVTDEPKELLTAGPGVLGDDCDRGARMRDGRMHVGRVGVDDFLLYGHLGPVPRLDFDSRPDPLVGFGYIDRDGSAGRGRRAPDGGGEK